MRSKSALLVSPIILALLAAPAATMATAATKASSKTVTIGVTEMLTGSGAFYGNAVLEGINVALDEINAGGGILGQKVVLQVKDNASDNAQATSIIKGFAQDKKIGAAIPPTYQPNFNAACASANSGALPIVSAQSGPPDPKNNTKGYCYTMTTDPIPQVAFTLKYLQEKKAAKKFVLVYDQDNGYVAFQRPNIKAAAATLGITFTEIGVAAGTTDYGPQISKLLEEKPDAVFPFFTIEDGARFIQQAKAKGYDKLFFDPVSQLTSKRIPELSGGAAIGMLASTPQSANDVKSFQTFLDLYKKKAGKELDDPTYTGFGYDSLKAVAKAMTDAKSTTDRVKIKKALDAMKTPCYSICFTPGTGANAGAFIASDFYMVMLTDKGFVAAK